MAVALENLMGPFGCRRWMGGVAALLTGVCQITGAWATTVQVMVTNSAGQPLSDAVVFLDSPDARARARPLVQVAISQQAKQFVPAVSVVTVGTSVVFPNRDTVRHHVYSFSPIKTFEIKLYVGTPSEPVVFDKPGIAALGCNIHDNMAAWTVVVETPWFGKTDSHGQVALNQVLPGNYRLRSWHPDMPMGAPAHEQTLVVPPQGLIHRQVQFRRSP
jgi:plastocyanin